MIIMTKQNINKGSQECLKLKISLLYQRLVTGYNAKRIRTEIERKGVIRRVT